MCFSVFLRSIKLQHFSSFTYLFIQQISVVCLQCLCLLVPFLYLASYPLLTDYQFVGVSSSESASVLVFAVSVFLRSIKLQHFSSFTYLFIQQISVVCLQCLCLLVPFLYLASYPLLTDY